MTIQNNEKLKYLLEDWPHGLVATASWLEEQGLSRSNLQNYLTSGWIHRIGPGAYKRPEDVISWENGLETLQSQLTLDIHAGGITALVRQGYGHYLRLGEESITLFTSPKTNTPKWFKAYSSWKGQLKLIQTNVIPPYVGITEHQGPNWRINISSPERALLECLYCAPKSISWVECYELLEGLNTLRPNLLTQLLNETKSIKVKRVFLYLADKLQHPWYKHLVLDDVDLGLGDRLLEKGGVYIPKFKLVVPSALAEIQ